MDTTQSRIVESKVPTHVLPSKTTQPFTRLNGRLVLPEGTGRPQFMMRKEVTQVPASDSLLHHNRQFAGILTSMGILQDTQLEILQTIESDARRGFSCSTIVLRILVVTCQEYGLNVTEDNTALAKRKPVELLATQLSVNTLKRLVFDGLGVVRSAWEILKLV